MAKSKVDKYLNSRGDLDYSKVASMNTADAYALAKSQRDKLIKRRNRLEAQAKRHPTEYVHNGLDALRNDIPMVSKSMKLGELKHAIYEMNALTNMKSANVKGARDMQTERIKRQLGLEGKKRLNANDRLQIARFRQKLFKDKRLGYDMQSIFWRQFNKIKDSDRFRKYDSDQLLESFRFTFDENAMSWGDVQDKLYARMKAVEQEEYDKLGLTRDDLF